MDDIEFCKEEVHIFDSLVELRTRIRCQEELYLFALERHRTYGDMNKGKTMPSLHNGISEDGEISETLFNFYVRSSIMSIPNTSQNAWMIQKPSFRNCIKNTKIWGQMMVNNANLRLTNVKSVNNQK